MDWLERLFGRKTKRPKIPVIASITLPPTDGLQMAYGDKLLRKQWAEEVLRAEGVPVNPHLPMIEGEAEITLRRKDEVARRLLALAIVAVKGEGLEQRRVLEIISERNAHAMFTPLERAFIDDSDPSRHDRIQFCWRYEAAWVLAWALNLRRESLGVPRQICEPAWLVETVRDTVALDKFGLRPANDILNEADLIYRYHWAVRQAGIKGDDVPAGLEPGVVLERHYALNWLIGYNDNADWDDVTTDT